MFNVQRQEGAVKTQTSAGRTSCREQWSDSAVARSREEGLDDTLSETFPCSDPLSSIPHPAKV
jgi:hypothetical protein